MNTKTFTLITGASTGIGYELAQQLAALKHNLILVARSHDKLEKLQADLITKYGVEVNYINVDLSVPGAAEQLYQDILKQKWVVNKLVNNAGFGTYGNVIDYLLQTDVDMINLNVTSLVTLSKLFGADMAKRKAGKIMNVASILSFLPLPYYSVYSATKSFVLAFSETLATELEPSGVTVTALCPGTVETPFHTPEMRKTNAMRANKPMPPADVARAGVQLLEYGKGKKVVGFMNWILTQTPRVTPSAIMKMIKKNLASQK